VFLFLPLQTGLPVKKEENERKNRQRFALSYYPFLPNNLRMKKKAGSSNNKHDTFVP